MILLVEDEPTLRRSLGDLLRLFNYQVLFAANGLEALQVFEDRRSVICLVLSDVVMPEMGGLEMCQKLRQLDDNLPLVIMSGYSADFNPAELERLKVSAFLQKPMSPQELTATLDRVLHSA